VVAKEAKDRIQASDTTTKILPFKVSSEADLITKV